jgi:hypothetical protein
MRCKPVRRPAVDQTLRTVALRFLRPLLWPSEGREKPHSNLINRRDDVKKYLYIMNGTSYW